MTKGAFSKDAIRGWEQTERIIQDQIKKLESDLFDQKRKLQETHAYLNVCRTPPTARNVLFTHTITGMQEHFENARYLSYPYVAWNSRLYTVHEVMIGELSDFGL